METGKLMKALGYIAIIGIIVFFVMGLLSSISISLTLSHISSNFDIIIVLNLIILIGALCLFAHYFRNRNDKTKIEGVILIIADPESFCYFARAGFKLLKHNVNRSR